MLRILNQGGDLMILPSSADGQDATVSPIEKQLNTQALARLRQGGYILRRPNEVIEFLSRHSSLVEILEEAPRQIHRHFGDGTSSLILEVIQDPDAEGDEELILFIQTKLPVEYYKLAQELAGISQTPADAEAKMRAAISRMYYAAFCQARNYLRDREGLTIPAGARAHRFACDTFRNSQDRMRQKVGDRLDKLRVHRNRAD
jgi:hypothetical protein